MSDQKTHTFTAVTYNCLHPDYFSPKYYGEDPSYGVEHRYPLILKLLSETNADVIFLQELSRDLCDLLRGKKNSVASNLSTQYESVAIPKPDTKAQDYLAIFYKREVWEYTKPCYVSSPSRNTNMCSDGKSHIVSIELCHKASKRNVTLACAHLEGYPAALPQRMSIVADFLDLHVKDDSVLIAGDFNATRDEPVYQLVTKGTVEKRTETVAFDDKEQVVQIPETRLLACKGLLTSKERYSSPLTDLSIEADQSEGTDGTFYTKSIPFKNVDYVFGSQGVFECKQLISPKKGSFDPNVEAPLPNIKYPSDHLLLHLEIEIKDTSVLY